MAPKNGAPAVESFGENESEYEESLIDATAAGSDPRPAADLRMDMDAAISSMPERLQPIARLLMVHSPIEVARILGTSPAAITRAKAAIRAHFVEVGLTPF